MSSTHEERLDRMLAEGKITREQYDELRQSLMGEEAVPEASPSFQRDMKAPAGEDFISTARQLPWPVIACAICLFFFTFLDAFLNLASGSFPLKNLIGYTLQIFLGVGLLKSWRWAWVGTALLMGVNFTVILRHMGEHAILVLPFFLYVAFFICLAMAYKHFFPEPLAVKLRRWRELPSPLVMWQRAPWSVRGLGIYLIVEAFVHLCMGWVMYPKLVEFAGNQPGNQLSDMRFLWFEAMTPGEGIAAAIVGMVVILGLTYRVRWIYVVFLILCVGGLGYDLLEIMRNVRGILLVPIALDLLMIGLLLKAWEWFMHDARGEENQSATPTGQLNRSA